MFMVILRSMDTFSALNYKNKVTNQEVHDESERIVTFIQQIQFHRQFNTTNKNRINKKLAKILDPVSHIKNSKNKINWT